MPNSITYKEHANTGNYSWKEFEHTVMLNDGDDVEQRTLELMNFVQRMIGYKESKEELDRLSARVEELQTRIEELKNERSKLLNHVRDLKEKYDSDCLTPDSFEVPNSNLEPDPDDIPFDNNTFEGGGF